MITVDTVPQSSATSGHIRHHHRRYVPPSGPRTSTIVTNEPRASYGHRHRPRDLHRCRLTERVCPWAFCFGAGTSPLPDRAAICLLSSGDVGGGGGVYGPVAVQRSRPGASSLVLPSLIGRYAPRPETTQKFRLSPELNRSPLGSWNAPPPSEF